MRHGHMDKNRLNQSGVVAILVAIMLTVFVGIAAVAVDIGYMMVARNQSQNAADAAALAGARQMGENYYDVIDPSTNVTTVAQGTAELNAVAAKNLAADNVVTQIGTWDSTNKTFAATSVDPDAVQAVVTRAKGLTNGPINTFFAPILGVKNVKSGATAVASLSGTCTAGVGLPLGIGKSWFTNIGANKGCTQIAVNDTTNSCAGWTVLSPAKYDWKVVDAMINGTTPIPTLTVGETVNFGGGTVQNIVTDLLALFNRKATGNPPTWTTDVVVYDDGGTCVNPNTGYVIIGFAKITITQVITTGNNKGPVGVVDCNVADQGRGGCFYAGTYGTIPGLVQ